MSQIRNIIFDFDGTLVDTAPLIIATMQETISLLGLPPKSAEECKATIGLRLGEIPGVLWPERVGLGEIFADNYRRIFDRLKRPLAVKCFPGVTDGLRLLHRRGLGLAIASSRNHKSLAEYVEQFDLGDCFGMLVGGDDVSNGKPAPDPVLSILDRLGWRAEETLTVGDAAVDILMGKGGGTLTCAVTYGNGTEQELASAHPDYTVSCFASLIEITV